jgi:two-component system, chemotaxis family, chemotaxis protein CheY
LNLWKIILRRTAHNLVQEFGGRMGYNILIVDDSSVMRKIIRRNVRLTGVQMNQEFEAGDGLEALNVLTHHPVDLIFSDVNMPNMDGVSFVKQVRTKSDNEHVKIIMISTEASLDIVNEAISAGANDYIVKPFTPDQLNQKMVSVLN